MSKPKFAKRHYEAVALAMQEALRITNAWPDNGRNDQTARGGVDTAIAQLANTFSSDNGLFKRDRFIRACEPGANVRARS